MSRPYNPIAHADISAFRCVAIRAADGKVAAAAENGADFAGVTAKTAKAGEPVKTWVKGDRVEVIVDTALDLSNGRDLTVGASGGVKEKGANTTVLQWLPRTGEITAAAQTTVIAVVV